MTDHALGMIGYGPLSLASSPRQVEGHINRLSHPYELTVGSTEPIRPYVIPWPLSADRWGVTYPAGLVGVTQINGILGTSTSGAYNARWEAYWLKQGENLGLVAVPGVLPGGYTANPESNWRSHADSMAGTWDANGLNIATWLPSAFPWGYTAFYQTGGNVGLYSAPGMHRGTYDGPTTGMGGWRKLQYKVSYTTTRFPEDAWTGSVVITLHRNADGTYPTLDGSGQPIIGDTIDHTASYARAVGFTHVGAAVFETAWIDVGIVQSNVGVPTHWLLDIDLRSISNIFTGNTPTIRPNSGGVRVSFRLSPRLDVPYPKTHVGVGDLIAPGGYVP